VQPDASRAVAPYVVGYSHGMVNVAPKRDIGPGFTAALYSLDGKEIVRVPRLHGAFFLHICSSDNRKSIVKVLDFID